ncbi:MAG: hypothetical protein ACYC3G_02885 [Minisyncoccota bacterium]
MSNEKFTQGEWSPKIIDLVDYRITAVSTLSKVICHCVTEDFDEASANTKLIAAAPDLYLALKELKEAACKILTVEMVDLDDSLCQAMDALEKAVPSL